MGCWVGWYIGVLWSLGIIHEGERWKVEGGREMEVRGPHCDPNVVFATYAAYVHALHSSVLTWVIPSTARTAHDQAFDKRQCHGAAILPDTLPPKPSLSLT